MSERQMTEKMAIWLAVNSIMRWIGQPEVLFGEFNENLKEVTENTDPVVIARQVLTAREVA